MSLGTAAEGYWSSALPKLGVVSFIIWNGGPMDPRIPPPNTPGEELSLDPGLLDHECYERKPYRVYNALSRYSGLWARWGNPY